MDNKKIIAIDGNSLINRAYYALPPLSTKNGVYTNAVLGFINMMNKLIDEYNPKYMVVAFDLKGPTFRHLEYKAYKAGRKKTPFELLQQFPLLKKILIAMDIKIIEMESFEADDVIGTIVKRSEEAGLEPYVITGDKDALQLASDITKIIITRKGISDFDIYDKDAMIERYHMTPEQFIDLKGLMGDNSDNIPGIPGIGEKTGIALIEQFGSIENLINNTEQIKKPKLREKVEENVSIALLSRKLAEINTNVPVEINFDEMKAENPNREKLVELYRELELFSLVTKIDKSWIGRRLKGILTTEEKEVENNYADLGDEITKKKEDNSSVEIVEIKWNGIIDSNMENFKSELENQEYAYVKIFGDCNHVSDPEIFGVAINFQEDLYYFKDQKKIVEAFELMAENKIRFKGHLLKDDYFMLKTILPDNYIYRTAFDSGIAQYVLDPQKNDFGYNSISTIYLGKEMEDEKQFYKNNAQADLFGCVDNAFAEYAINCIKLDRAVEKVMTNQIKDFGMSDVYYNIELPLIEIFADMEYRGFKTDKNELVELGKSLDKDICELKERIYAESGEKFNINSPKQLGVILFEKMSLPKAKKTKNGYSTSVEVLEKLKEDYEIVDLVLKYRTLSKLKSTYVDGLLPLISKKDGKIRAHFQQTGTATGRISCTDPNLQNIPVRQELGRQIRKAFIADDECVLVDADYSQIELRLLAHISEDKGLIEAFHTGADIHKSTASKVFEVPEEEVTSIQRSNAKAVNFGVIYGMSSFGLSGNLNITRKEAEKYINEYFEKYSNVKRYMDETVKICKQNGYVLTIKGRRRDIPSIRASNYMQRQAGERLAMNTPIQGSAADIIKLAMIKVFNELREKNYKSKLILQIHDELIINTVTEEFETVKELLKRNMMEAEKLLVPLEIEMDSGLSWYDVK